MSNRDAPRKGSYNVTQYNWIRPHNVRTGSPHEKEGYHTKIKKAERSRCPGCGALVTMPCLKCYLDEHHAKSSRS